MRRASGRIWAAALLLLAGPAARAQKSEPANLYLFPAGGQRGTRVTVALEGENVTPRSEFHLAARGITAPARTEGGRITLTLAPDIPTGIVGWRAANAQGGAGGRGFAVGEFPEILEEERGADATPQAVTLPVTVNGRINPHADVDRFSFTLRAGQQFSAEVTAARLGGPIDTNVFVGQFGNPPGDVTYKQLDASLSVTGPDGSLVARAEDTFGLDPALGFVAPADGRYVVAVHHLAHLGMPQFVYRLTLAPRPLVDAVYPAGGRRGSSVQVELSGPSLGRGGTPTVRTVRIDAPAGVPAFTAGIPEGSIVLQAGDAPETLETEPNDSPPQAGPAVLPGVLNGRFLTPGDSDFYRAALRKGEIWRLELWMDRIGSPADALLSVTDAAGRVLATNDDGAAGSRDPVLWFTPPADGEYLLQVRDGSMSRLGTRLVYRLDARIQAPEFRAEAAPEFLDLAPGGSGEINVSVERWGGFNAPVTFDAEGLPDGVTVQALELKPNQAKGKLRFQASAAALPGSRRVRLVARSTLDSGAVSQAVACAVTNPAETAAGGAPRYLEDLLLAVRFPPPFQVEADDSYTFMNLGTLYPAKIGITRDPGFTAPIRLAMADRQPRSPDGITFPPMVVSDGRAEVFFPMRLPQGPRGNAIVRTYVKGESVATDASGREWDILFTSTKQVVLRTQAPVLSLEAEPGVLHAAAASEAPVTFRLGRTAAAMEAAEIRMLPAEGMRGVTMEPVRVAAGESAAQGILRIAADARMARDQTLWFEVTSRRENGWVIFFLAPVTLDLR